MNPERVHDIGAVNGDGVRAEIERCCDFLVGFAIDNHLQNFQLTRGQRVTLSLQPGMTISGRFAFKGLSTPASLTDARLSLEDGLKLEAELFAQLFNTADAREGTRAFLEKRAPEFKGN